VEISWFYVNSARHCPQNMRQRLCGNKETLGVGNDRYRHARART